MSSILSYLGMILVSNDYPLINLILISVQGFKLPKTLENYLQADILQNKITIEIKVFLNNDSISEKQIFIFHNL